MRRPRQRFGRPPRRLAARVPAHYSVVHCRKNARRSCASPPHREAPQPEARAPFAGGGPPGGSSRPGHPGSLTPTGGCGKARARGEAIAPATGMVACAPSVARWSGPFGRLARACGEKTCSHGAPGACPWNGSGLFFPGRNGLAVAGAALAITRAMIGARGLGTATRTASWHGSRPVDGPQSGSTSSRWRRLGCRPIASVPNPAAPVPDGAGVQQFLLAEKRLGDQRMQMVGAADRGAATAEIAFDGFIFAVETCAQFQASACRAGAR